MLRRKIGREGLVQNKQPPRRRVGRTLGLGSRGRYDQKEGQSKKKMNPFLSSRSQYADDIKDSILPLLESKGVTELEMRHHLPLSHCCLDSLLRKKCTKVGCSFRGTHEKLEGRERAGIIASLKKELEKIED
jgi:hypothetical protein